MKNEKKNAINSIKKIVKDYNFTCEKGNEITIVFVEKNIKLSSKEILIEWIKRGDVKPSKCRTLDDLLTLANNL